MTITYRMMRPDEEGAAVSLWTDALGTSRDEALRTYRDFQDDPERYARTVVAVAPDGTLLATVCYWLRQIQDRSGTSCRVGQIFHVATRADARGQGHATELLGQAIDGMREAGCVWSVLSARQAAQPLYMRLGWRSFAQTYWRGTFTSEDWNRAGVYPVRNYDPRREPEGWAVLANVYAAYNGTRPVSMVREPAYWQGYIAWMFTQYLDQHQSTLLVAYDPMNDRLLHGYALVNFYDQGFVISELAVQPGDEGTLTAVLNGVLAESECRGIALQGQLIAPMEPLTTNVLRRFFGSSMHQIEDYTFQGYSPLMARSIASDMTDADLDTLFSAPGATFWPLDAY